jgi:hypothetical protein
MWMGGILPLGYDAPTDPVTRALVVNAEEAETVRSIFARYLEIGSVHELKRRLDADGVSPKRSRSGAVPTYFSRGALFHLLKNRTYVGEIPHRDRSYPGAHPAIVEREVFDAAQQLLASQTQRHRDRPLRRSSMLLTGRLFDASGDPMSPTFTQGAKGQVYRYYVSTALQSGRRPSGDDAIRRVPAAAIERLVREMIGQVSPHAPFEAVTRVEVHATCVHVVVDVQRLLGRPASACDAALEVQPRTRTGHRVMVESDAPAQLRLINPVRLALRGGRKLVLDAEGRRTGGEQRPDPVLIRALRASHEHLAALGEGPVGRPEVARLSSSPANPYERNLIRLAFLAPDLQAAILEGRQPEGLTLQALIETELPAAWPDQWAWAAALG